MSAKDTVITQLSREQIRQLLYKLAEAGDKPPHEYCTEQDKIEILRALKQLGDTSLEDVYEALTREQYSPRTND